MSRITNIGLSADECKEDVCEYDKGKSGRSLKDPKADAVLQPPEQEGALMASTSVFVLEPGQEVGQYLAHIKILFLQMCNFIHLRFSMISMIK